MILIRQATDAKDKSAATYIPEYLNLIAPPSHTQFTLIENSAQPVYDDNKTAYQYTVNRDMMFMWNKLPLLFPDKYVPNIIALAPDNELTRYIEQQVKSYRDTQEGIQGGNILFNQQFRFYNSYDEIKDYVRSKDYEDGPKVM